MVDDRRLTERRIGKMLSGHLQEKNNWYYAVLSCKRRDGRRYAKWIKTGIQCKRGNRKLAERFLDELRVKFNIYGELITEEENNIISKSTTENRIDKLNNKNDHENMIQYHRDILFADYMLIWLRIKKLDIDPVTYVGYYNNVVNVIYPYFFKKGIKLIEMTRQDIKDFYLYERMGGDNSKIKKGTTIARYHANIHSALEMAVDDEIIPINISHNLKPKTEEYIGDYYSIEEVKQLISFAKGTKIEIAVLFGLIYGLRRSEIVGLRWKCFDFDNNIFSITHTVTSVHVKGKSLICAKDKTKNRSSLRSFPLLPYIKEFLVRWNQQIENNKRIFGNSYNYEYEEYIYVDEMGNRIKPEYISSTFKKFLEKHNMRHIRFHDTRHTCASVLLNFGDRLDDIQPWLGHSSRKTTERYAHMNVSLSKMNSANLISSKILTEQIQKQEDEK